MTVNLFSPDDIGRGVAGRARALRLAAGLTQQGLAERAGVSLGSLKRFERTGAASLELVVRVAFALRAEDGFGALFAPGAQASLDEMRRAERPRERGRVK